MIMALIVMDTPPPARAPSPNARYNRHRHHDQHCVTSVLSDGSGVLRAVVRASSDILQQVSDGAVLPLRPQPVRCQVRMKKARVTRCSRVLCSTYSRKEFDVYVRFFVAVHFFFCQPWVYMCARVLLGGQCERVTNEAFAVGIRLVGVCCAISVRMLVRKRTWLT